MKWIKESEKYIGELQITQNDIKKQLPLRNKLQKKKKNSKDYWQLVDRNKKHQKIMKVYK